MPIIDVSLIEGRSVAQKREFAQAVTEAAARILVCPKESVKILYYDLNTEDLSEGGVLRCDKK